MDDTEIINQAIVGIIDTELVAKQLEQAFKDVRYIFSRFSYSFFILILNIIYALFKNRKSLQMHQVSKCQMKKLWQMCIKGYYCLQLLNLY